LAVRKAEKVKKGLLGKKVLFFAPAITANVLTILKANKRYPLKVK
jgi:hypothetical protein